MNTRATEKKPSPWSARATHGLADLVRFLLSPSSYGEPTTHVEHFETHISHVFLTDCHAYKIKKPVRFPFLDYSTLERRRVACEEEVRLNRRLAPGVYLGVVPIALSSTGRFQIAGSNEVVEYCVHMNRLPTERMLDHMILAGTATHEHIERLLDLLVPFYAHAVRGPDMDREATAEAAEANVRQNLAMIGDADHGSPQAMLQRIRCSQLQFLKLSADVFAERIRSGEVCEGHGDLRPEHVCLLESGPVVFDCVEFSLAFRAADVASELAFLAMECDFLGAPELGKRLLDGFRVRAAGDFSDRLASFYKAYRACVRGKVELLRASQEAGAEAEQVRIRARRYLQLASYYATEFYRPKLFVMIGAAGTGKSSVADALAETLGLEVLRTDAIRHELAGHRERNADYLEGIYAPSFTECTYEALLERAEAIGKQSVSLVIDGTFRDAKYRARAVELAQRCGADIHFIYCECPADVARRRIAARATQPDSLSDARPELHEIQRRQLDADAELHALPLIRTDTTNTVDSAVKNVLAALQPTASHGAPLRNSRGERRRD